MDAQPYSWALKADMSMKEKLLERNHRDLINYQSMGREALLAVPTLDHYLPMIYTVALQENDEPLRFVHEGFQHGSISMRCFQIG